MIVNLVVTLYMSSVLWEGVIPSQKDHSVWITALRIQKVMTNHLYIMSENSRLPARPVRLHNSPCVLVVYIYMYFEYN